MKYFFCIRSILCKFLYSFFPEFTSIYLHKPCSLISTFPSMNFTTCPYSWLCGKCSYKLPGAAFIGLQVEFPQSQTFRAQLLQLMRTPQCSSFRANTSCPHSIISQEHENQVPIWQYKRRETFHIFFWDWKNKKSLHYDSFKNDSNFWNKTLSAVFW